MSNIHKIRISGTTEIDSHLDLKSDYSLILKRCAIKSVVKKSTNENDDFTYTYNLESLDIATLINEGGTIQGKAKSISKSMRGAIWHLAQDLDVEDEEKFYQSFGKEIIARLPEIYEFLKK